MEGLSSTPEYASTPQPASERGGEGMNGYKWAVLFTAWLGWGFDVFDGLLFSYVAPNCVPTLLGLPIGSPQAKAATLVWAGALTSLLLIGWAIGGIFFGWLSDRIGHMHTLLITMALYSIGTALCALAPNIWILAFCRLIASLGIGGEWAAGAAMVAGIAPRKWRMEAGALLCTASPMGLFLATLVNYQIAGVYFKNHPETSWRYVFLFGLLPACVALVTRLALPKIKHVKIAQPRLSDLFTPEMYPRTRSGFLMALTALIAWWSCNAFIPTVATGLARESAALHGLDRAAADLLAEQWKVTATNSFNLGGLLGTLLTVPIAKRWGRRPMFAIYFAASAASLMAAFGLNLPPGLRLLMYFPIGLSVFGVFGSFTYYLPELFPPHLRATGAGFCYNAGRVLAAIGPFLVGRVASLGADALASALTALFWVGFVPLAGLFCIMVRVTTLGKPARFWILETRDAVFEMGGAADEAHAAV